MSMAEPKIKKKWSHTFNGRGTAWTNDDEKFGHKLLEKMGWSKGQGLGREQQGIVEPVAVRLKNDSKGVGYKGHDDQWIQHYEDFEDILADLNKKHQDTDGGEATTGQNTVTKTSLESSSKASRARVHYHKFTRGKDLSKCSADDLGCILGSKRAKKLKDTKCSEVPDSVEGSITHTQGVTTIKRCSINDYFASKMQMKTNKSNMNNQPWSTNEDRGEEEEEEEEDEEGRTKVGFGYFTNGEDKFNQQMESKEEEDMAHSGFGTFSNSYDPMSLLRAQLKNNKKEEKEEDNNSVTKSPGKDKKKKKKRIDAEEKNKKGKKGKENIKEGLNGLNGSLSEESNPINISNGKDKKKKKKGKKEEEVMDFDVCEPISVVKEKKKKQRTEHIENGVEEEDGMNLGMNELEDGKVEKKKKKKRKVEMEAEEKNEEEVISKNKKKKIQVEEEENSVTNKKTKKKKKEVESTFAGEGEMESCPENDSSEILTKEEKKDRKGKNSITNKDGICLEDNNSLPGKIEANNESLGDKKKRKKRDEGMAESYVEEQLHNSMKKSENVSNKKTYEEKEEVICLEGNKDLKRKKTKKDVEKKEENCIGSEIILDNNNDLAKKKKKRKTEVENEVSLINDKPDGCIEESQNGTKKKKRKTEGNDENCLANEDKNENGTEISKKKKRKSIQPMEKEIVLCSDSGSEDENETVKKKKKKKKKKETGQENHCTEDSRTNTEERIAQDSNESNTNKTKKKKGNG